MEYTNAMNSVHIFHSPTIKIVPYERLRISPMRFSHLNFSYSLALHLMLIAIIHIPNKYFDILKNGYITNSVKLLKMAQLRVEIVRHVLEFHS